MSELKVSPAEKQHTDQSDMKEEVFHIPSQIAHPVHKEAPHLRSNYFPPTQQQTPRTVLSDWSSNSSSTYTYLHIWFLLIKLETSVTNLWSGSLWLHKIHTDAHQRSFPACFSGTRVYNFVCISFCCGLLLSTSVQLKWQCVTRPVLSNFRAR